MQPPNWPNDADGDVFRRLHAQGFDFSKRYEIDFNIDFKEWPPSVEALTKLSKECPNSKQYVDDDSSGGYVGFQLTDYLDYDLVIRTQRHVTALMAPYGGICESWGVLHD